MCNLQVTSFRKANCPPPLFSSFLWARRGDVVVVGQQLNERYKKTNMLRGWPQKKIKEPGSLNYFMEQNSLPDSQSAYWWNVTY